MEVGGHTRQGWESLLTLARSFFPACLFCYLCNLTIIGLVEFEMFMQVHVHGLLSV